MPDELIRFQGGRAFFTTDVLVSGACVWPVAPLKEGESLINVETDPGVEYVIPVSANIRLFDAPPE